MNYDDIKSVLCANIPGCDKPNLSFVEKFEQFMKLKDTIRESEC